MSKQRLGAGSVVSSARDFAKWMDFLLHVNGEGEPALTEAQTGQHIVGTDWARLLLYGDPSVDHIGGLRYGSDAGDVAAAGFGFDLIGTLFEGERLKTSQATGQNPKYEILATAGALVPFSALLAYR
jgi:hypothetical protein